MKEMRVSDLRESLAEVVNQVAYANERVMLTRHDKQLAAVISLQDLQLLERLENSTDLEDARNALAEAKGSGEKNIAWPDLKKQLG